MNETADSEVYTPVEPNFYHYKSLGTLYQDYSTYLEMPNNKETIEKVHFCAYQIVNDSMYPFLQFLLKNDLYDNKLSFIQIDLARMKFVDNEKLLDHYKNYLLNYLQHIDITKNIDALFVDFKGFCVVDKEMYLFYDLTNCKFVLNDISVESPFWFALVDEIMNQRMVAGIPINHTVTDFFTKNNNSQFLFLYDKNYKKYEVPTVAYVCKPENKTKFTYIFGTTVTESIFGQYFYFTNYENCLKQMENSEENRVGLVRFALFLQKYKFVENLLSDSIDESEIKQERLLDENLDTKFERLTMRISDYDGTWTKDYDSIEVFNAELDDGSTMKNTPIICVKKYEQQYPLSYHFVSKPRNSEQFIRIL
jgi:hypothetical protein